MRVALIYPPPWKIATPGEAEASSAAGGPPPGWEGRVPGGDFVGAPTGLLQLAAEAERAGHEVTALNLSTFAWGEVERVLAGLEAELYGLSVFTANRRGAALVAELIRRLHPAALVVVGGPHPTALPEETLRRWPAVDLVIVGEGEETFLELCRRVESREPLTGVSGTASREGGEVLLAPARPPIADLDALAQLHERFATPFLLTSRGCPGRCAFCGSRGVWGRRVRRHGAERVLDSLELIVRRQGQPLVAIKDDTFTASRRRALAICRGIEARGLSFLWLCDTRADALDEELVAAMRRAGCARVSLGVESGSPAILERLGKRLDLEAVRRATRLARAYGLLIRWYLILGSPGETAETIEQTFALIREERPHQVVFSALSTYPGTELAERAIAAGELDRAYSFADPFWTPTLWLGVDDETRARLEALLAELPGIGRVCRPRVEECRGALERLPAVAANLMDLGLALAEAGEAGEAAERIAEALTRGYPIPGVGQNALACLAARRGDLDAAEALLEEAARGYPLRHVDENLGRLEAWRARGGEAPALELYPTLELAEELRQPMNPGPLEAPSGRR